MSKTVEQLRQEHEARMAEPEVLQIDYHRNGIGGDGFFVALVRDPEVDQRVLVVIVPSWALTKKSPGGGKACFAVDPELASGPWTKPGTIAFGDNSWRGDHYFDLVVAAAKNWGQS